MLLVPVLPVPLMLITLLPIPRGGAGAAADTTTGAETTAATGGGSRGCMIGWKMMQQYASCVSDDMVRLGPTKGG